jgi:hypothetical protein
VQEREVTTKLTPYLGWSLSWKAEAIKWFPYHPFVHAIRHRDDVTGIIEDNQLRGTNAGGTSGRNSQRVYAEPSYVRGMIPGHLQHESII